MERIKLVLMQREDRGEGSMAQRGKSVAKWHTVRRTGKHSKRGVVKRRSGEPSKC